MDYKNMTLLQLRAMAKERGLRGISTLKKEQLIERLQESEKAPEQAGVERPERSASYVSERGRDNGVERAERAASYVSERGRDSGVERAERSPSYSSERGRNDGERAGRERTGRDGNGRPEYDRRNGERFDYHNRRNANVEPPSYERTDGERPERQEHNGTENGMKSELESLDSGEKANGILEVMPDGFGFIRCENYLPGENDVYVSPSQIRRFNLKTGDILIGNTRVKTQNEKYSALLYVESVNGYKPYEAQRRKSFEDLTPIFPNERIRLELPGAPVSMRMVDLLSPIGKGQRGMIVSQPKTGKTTLLKQIAKSITTAYKDMKLIVLLIDERPEEVTDIREYIEGPNAEVIYSTFDELPEHHKRVSEMVLERAKRLVEHGEDVVILLDSITRLARAYNLVVPPSGRTLSGGLDPAALHMPKKFFGAARNMREGGSLTILATALVDTGSKMDDVVFEEFKGTGNMELVLDRKLAEKRIFPAINIQKSGTRRDDLLLSKEEQEIVFALHREMSGSRAEENVEQILQFFKRTKNNAEFIQAMRQSLLK
ncbi:MAG TPA: transcription termination factor Rho [Candidatus Anaerobutyricum stercoripullorum]|uniref:Transcription termination factor Rho n=1 Tax=Candidatus Anaerobutyricum stercoripullorum TaxID=2838456 RepID=A0A9D1X3V8_9FIRM|nr:transcription termination factor Rho [Candidatus Anaerobutyricum stercoripullorum]